MNIIKKEGFTVLPLNELVQRALKPEGSTNAVDEKIVSITFDDAYRSIYTTAFPNLRARGWPFTIFTATQLIKEKSDLYLCLLYTSPSPRDGLLSRMPSSA